MKSLLLASLFSLGTSAFVNISDFDWSLVKPSTSLNYTSCYDGHKCAKLLVPLDWLNPESNDTKVSLAIVARPAVVAENDDTFGGTIILNPGGPSGSGVQFLLNRGQGIQLQADSEFRKHEILSFDPRGVALTEPSADCFEDEFARGAFTMEDRVMGTLSSAIDVVRRRIARAGAFGRLCEAGQESGQNIRNFMSTSSVARDMVAIVNSLDELRKKDSDTTDSEQDRLELRSAYKKDETPRLQYWGFSYGTVLGNYFASMFPGRVGRMILEGVEDPYDYTNSTWAGNLVDTQKTLEHFWETCYEGGSRCALYRDTDTSSSDVRDRARAFLDRLDESPAPYVSSKRAISITEEDVLNNIFRALYSPQKSFPPLAVAINEGINGNLTQLFKGIDLATIEKSCNLRHPEVYTWNTDAQTAIACGDGDSQNDMTTQEFLEYINKLKADSPDFGPHWSLIRMSCKGWPFRPAYRFSGPWETPEADASLVQGKPAAPILFVSSLLDPVTPAVNAYEAAKGHPGAAVLVQNSVGHGASFMPGKCREDYVKNYFATGELPLKEVHCEAECRPFQECKGYEVGVYGWGDDDGLETLRRSPLSVFG